MEFNAGTTLMKPSALAVSKRRVLILYLQESLAYLVYGLAADGHGELVRPMLEVNAALGDLTDDICRTDDNYSDEVIAGAVSLIRISQALLKDRTIVQTIH